MSNPTTPQPDPKAPPAPQPVRGPRVAEDAVTERFERPAPKGPATPQGR